MRTTSLLLLFALVVSPQLGFSQGGLVAYYPFSGNANDASGNGNNGLPFGGVSLAVDRFGNPNSAYAFNGTGYITVNNSPSLQTGSVWSMAFWFKARGYGPDSNWMGMVTKAGPSVDYYSGPRHMLSYLNTSSPICYGSMGPPPYLNENRIPLEWNRWYHCALTSAGDSVRSYLNGTRKYTFPRDYSWTFSNSYPLTIGSQNGSFHNRYFNGSLDEVRIYNRALSQTEIEALYNNAVITSDTVALWHMDEVSGSLVLDSSPYRNNGSATGTAVVPGYVGNARSFNGRTDYVTVPHSSIFDFGTNESFTIDAWFKTTQQDIGQIVRRAVAPRPGYLIQILYGRVQAILGNREDGYPPDTLMKMTSNLTYNDGSWHRVTFIRDRSVRKLYLYVDGAQATLPINESIPFAIASNDPLTIGRWDYPAYPYFFNGTIDEVAIYRSAHHPGTFGVPDIQVSPSSLNFGNTLVGTTSILRLEIRNRGVADSLRVTEIGSNNSRFSPSLTRVTVPPGGSRILNVSYTPTTVQSDTGSLSFASNDPNKPLVRVFLGGRGFRLMPAPAVAWIRDIADDQGKQVRVSWFRSIYDGILDSLHATQYGIWRRVDDGRTRPIAGLREGSIVTMNGRQFAFSNNELWDFIANVPAVNTEQYAFVAPTLRDSTRSRGIQWSVFRISSHMTTGTFFFSAADSGYSVDNLPPAMPNNVSVQISNRTAHLTWDRVNDPDLDYFVIYRGSYPGFEPAQSNVLGTARTTEYSDGDLVGWRRAYYRVAAVDSAGNQGAFSEEVGVQLTDVPGEEQLPATFALRQNYPNPFNPETAIRFDVAATSHVTVGVYDVLGREVARLVEEVKPAGRYAVRWNALSLSSGVYLCRMTAGAFTSVAKMNLLK